MLIKLIFAAAILFFAFRWIKSYKSSSEQSQKEKMWQIMLVIIAIAIAFAVLTGKMHWLGALLAGALPFLQRILFAASRIAPFWLRKTGGIASFQTEHLDLKIDIPRKQISGTIKKGPHERRALQSLSNQEIEELITYYSGRDKKSLFFIRAIEKGFTAQEQTETQPFSDPSISESLEILGLSGSPSKEEIIQAHRRLINKLHPDRGGSDFLASRVNQARDILLKHLENH